MKKFLSKIADFFEDPFRPLVRYLHRKKYRYEIAVACGWMDWVDEKSELK